MPFHLQLHSNTAYSSTVTQTTVLIACRLLASKTFTEKGGKRKLVEFSFESKTVASKQKNKKMLLWFFCRLSWKISTKNCSRDKPNVRGVLTRQRKSRRKLTIWTVLYCTVLYCTVLYCTVRGTLYSNYVYFSLVIPASISLSFYLSLFSTFLSFNYVFIVKLPTHSLLLINSCIS